MRITLHEYVTDPHLPQKDGVNLAHENIGAMMHAHAGEHLQVGFHDFNRLLDDEHYAREVLKHADCVISNVGPHAHYYFYLRDRYQLNFRIFRDVRTAIWSSYLLQEYLCAPYLRSEDVLMTASHYTRAIYEKIFPHLQDHTCFRCYPLTVNFPEELPPRPAHVPGQPMILGYIGRLSEDKNFPDLIRLLIELNAVQPGGYKLLACGDIHSPACQPELIRSQVRAALGDGDYFEYLPSRKNEDIWALLRRFDVMLFPSTSNLETFGRVLVEASYAGVPVICGAHAAAPELMPESSLCAVDYRKDERFSTHFDHCMGTISISQMAEAVIGRKLQRSDGHREFLRHPEKFIRALSMEARQINRLDPLELKSAQHRLIASLDIHMPPIPVLDEANAAIASLIPWFGGLQQKDSAARRHFVSRLTEISTHPDRTRRYLEKSAQTRGDFTNVGGIDIELCHVLGFYPTFMIPSTGEGGDERHRDLSHMESQMAMDDIVLAGLAP